MRRNQGVLRAAVVLLVALVAVSVAAIGSARPDTVDTTAKLGPKPIRSGKDSLYRTTFTSTRGTMNKVSSTTTFPAGSTVVAFTPAAPTCNAAGLVVTCDFGNVAAGATVAASIRATLTNAGPAPVTVTVPTTWRFKDLGGGQPTGADSYDDEVVSDTTAVSPSANTSANGDCLSNAGGGGGLSANLGEAAISFTTPAFGSLLCVPLGLQVSPPRSTPVTCSPGRVCKSEVLTSFAGATFSAGAPAQGTLVWPNSSVLDKRARVVFNDGIHSPLLVPLCANVTLTAAIPACEVDRSFAQSRVSVIVRWLGNDPAWEM